MDSFFYINLDQPATSRYGLENFQALVNNGYDPLTSNILDQLQSIESGGQYTINGQESRPDLIARDVYGDTQYWWIILAYNAITSVSDLVNGLQVQYPRVDLLEDFYFALKPQQDAVDLAAESAST